MVSLTPWLGNNLAVYTSFSKYILTSWRNT
jgi:hypothetical protein